MMENRRDIIRRMQEEASVALINLLNAQEDMANEYVIENLQMELSRIQSSLEYEQKNEQKRWASMQNTGSTHLVNNMLAQYPAKIILQTSAKPLHVFSAEESSRINEHFKTLPPHLQALFNAALEDSTINFDTIKNPVFLKGEGYVYDANDVEQMLERNGIYPRNQDRKISREDIIPCNTLINAMFYLLKIIEGNIYIAEPVDINTFMLQPSEDKKVTISIEFIKKIEEFYANHIENKHRILFDTICRDSCTNIIMQQPIFLPDGFVYDLSTAETLLESAQSAGQGSAMCPKMDIPFKAEDITPCPMVIVIFEQIKRIMQAMMNQSQASHNNVNNEYKQVSYK